MSWVAIYFIIGLVIGVAWEGHKWLRDVRKHKLDEQERATRQYEEWK